MQQFLLAGLVGFGLAGNSTAVAAPGEVSEVRAGSIQAGAKSIPAGQLPAPNKYNPTLTARRQPQPIMADPGLPEEVPPQGPTAGMRMDNSAGDSLLDEMEPPKPSMPMMQRLENPIMDESALAEMPAEPWSSGSWFSSGKRYAGVDFVVFERARPKSRRAILAIDTGPTGGLFQAFSETFGTEAGVRATLGQNLFRDYLNRDHSVEATFFGINQFQISDAIDAQADNSLVTANLPGFNASDIVTSDQRSNFLSYELNYRLRTRLERDRMVMGPDGSWIRQYTHGHTFSFLIGLRHVTFDEEFLLTGRQDGVAPTVYAGDYQINTENDLLGMQLGGEMRSQYETWAWGFAGKAGAYVNFSDVHRQVTVATLPFYDVSPSLQDAAFLGEMSLFAAYNLSPNWTLRGSMDMVLLVGAAQAPFNIDYLFSSRPEVVNSGVVQLMGMSFGMEVVW